jgi:hypothetical protein
VNSENKDARPKDSPDPLRLMLAYLCIATEREASLETKVGILTRFDLTNIEIARVCGSKIQSVKNARHSLSKYGSKRKKTE